MLVQLMLVRYLFDTFFCLVETLGKRGENSPAIFAL